MHKQDLGLKSTAFPSACPRHIRRKHLCLKLRGASVTAYTPDLDLHALAYSLQEGEGAHLEVILCLGDSEAPSGSKPGHPVAPSGSFNIVRKEELKSLRTNQPRAAFYVATNQHKVLYQVAKYCKILKSCKS